MAVVHTITDWSIWVKGVDAATGKMVMHRITKLDLAVLPMRKGDNMPVFGTKGAEVVVLADENDGK